MEAVRAVCDHVRSDSGSAVVVARTHPSNAPSQALLESLRFRDRGEVSWGSEVRREYKLEET